MLLPAFHTNIWYDESYTVAMVTHSFSEIWEIGSKDVHPILYYYMIKILNLIFGTNIIIYRLFSVIPIAILTILGYTHIRKDFGEKTGLLFSFLITFFLVTIRYACEIRMYSWGMLFTTIMAIYAYRLYKDKFSNKNLIIFGIFSLAVAYTHYYGVMVAGLINVALFIYLLRNHKEKKAELIKFTICAVVQVALYLPWLFIFLSQVGTLASGGYWINISFPDTLIEVIGIQCSGYTIGKYTSFIIMLGLYTYVGYLIYKSKKEKVEMKPAILSAIIYFSVIISAYILSKILVPILLDRYLLIITGLITFFFAFFMAKQKNKYVTITICLAIFILSLTNLVKVININYSNTNTEMVQYINDNLQENDSFLIYNDEIGGFSITAKHLDHMQYFHDKGNWGAGGAYECFGPNFKRYNDLEDIMKEASGRIWIINIPEEDLTSEIKSKYNVEILERKEFQTKYNGYFFSFTLIEK